MVDYSSLIEDTFSGEQQAAKSQVVGSIGDEPDKAARAMELGQAWGVAPTIVYGDMDNFEREQKSMLASQIVGNNQHLQGYVNSHPLAAKISNDDYGQLDAASQAYNRAIGNKSLFQQYAGKPISILGKAFEGFKEGFGSEPIGTWISQTDYGKEYIKRYPYSAYLLAIEGGAFEIPARVFTGGLHAIKGATSETLQQMGASEQGSEQFARDLTGMAEQQLMGLTGVKVPVAATFEALRPVESYLRAGKEPPAGVHPIVDEIKAEQAGLDAENLGKAIKEAGATATLERSPEMLRQFYDQHPQANIGISADAIRELYGEKQPEPGDGVLGDLPRLREQMGAAEAIGGDVEVPLKDFVVAAAKDPEIYKALEDHVRFREGGVTVEEAKAGIEAYHGSPHEFEAFDIGKAGTGEGAQSYGFGHYVAESPEVAKSYSIDPSKFGLEGDKAGGGNLYRTRILRQPEEFLDWDKPLSEQPAGKKLLETMEPEFKTALEDILERNDQSELSELTGNELRQLLRRYASEDTLPGTKVEPGKEHFEKELADYLSGKGIAGIKYLDQFSRDHPRYAKDLAEAQAELATNPDAARSEMLRMQIEALEKHVAQKPTSNFVVFRDADLEILDRNGEAVKGLREANRLEPIGVPTTKATQLELHETTRMEDRAPFEKGAAIGMTADQYKRYQRLIVERREADAKAIDARAMAEQRKVQSAEWKANRAEMRPEVKAEIESRPDFELDAALREGKLKLSPEGLTNEELAAIPKEYISKDGVHPDDLIGLYGYNDSRGLIDDLVSLGRAREASGMKPKAFIERAIDAETDRRMEAKYGDLDARILEEAKDQVLTAIQEEMLHEEMLALASPKDAQFSLGKDQLRAWVKEKFDDTLVSQISSDKFLADAGRAGRETELALLKKDPAEAFRQKQRQFLAFSLAREAKKFEKSREQFEKTAKRNSAREVPSQDQEYTNWIHSVLLKVGEPVKRSVQDLEGELARGGTSGTTSLADFVNYKQTHGLREVPVADFLMEENFRKPVAQMTAAEFEALHSSVKALVANARDEKKVYKAGEEADLASIKGKMLEQIQRFKAYKFDAEGNIAQRLPRVRSLLRTVLVSHLQAETVMNRLDRFDPRGVFSQYVFRPLVEAANHEAKLLREYSTKLGAIADEANLREIIPNNVFMHPFDGGPMQLTRKNLRTILLNMGNESNFHKLAGGFLKQMEPEMEAGSNRLAVFKQEIRDWVEQNATKEDRVWAQKVWDMLEELHEKSSTMYRNLSGIAPEALPITPIVSGTKGGYYPLIRHPMFSEPVKLAKNGLEGEGYIRATTPAGYTKSRTGALYPLSLDLDSFPNQLRQIIHDISFRPAVIQAGKIFYDRKINAALKQHLGPEVSEMFVPWLRDVANVQNYMPAAMKSFQYWSDFMRQNAITTLVGLNIGTVMKHTPTAMISSMAEVGPANFLKAMKSLVAINEETGERNWQFAMKTSEELQRRSRNWAETMGGGLAQLEGRTTGRALVQGDYGSAFMSLRETITELSSKPVALGDLISAVPTWMAKYEAEMKNHGIHGDAVFAADKAVRQAHGSSAVTSRSQVARSRALSWFTGFFTFFNDLFNRQVETIWRAGEATKLAKQGQKAEAMAQVPKIAGRLFAYVIAPAIIEELVTPLASEKGESWGKVAAKALTFTLSASWVGVRDIVSAILNHRDPSVGLLSTVAKSGTDMVRDLSAKHPKPGNIIKHGTQLSGMLTGMTPAPIGRAAEFALSTERPKGPWGWLVGMRYGTLKHHSQTFEQYMKGH